MYLSCKQRRTVEEIKTSLQFPSGHGQSNGPESPTLKVWLLFCMGGEPCTMEGRAGVSLYLPFKLGSFGH